MRYTLLDKLNGWQRLWILVSAIYLVIVMITVCVNWPTENNTKITGDEIAKFLTTKSLNIIIKDKEQTDGLKAFKEMKSFGTGATMTLSQSTTQKELEYLGNDINGAIAKILYKVRIWYVIRALIAWIIPCLVVYALGLSLNWVYRGFKKG